MVEIKDPENTIIMETTTGKVVIQLLPEVAPRNKYCGDFSFTNCSISTKSNRNEAQTVFSCSTRTIKSLFIG